MALSAQTVPKPCRVRPHGQAVRREETEERAKPPPATMPDLRQPSSNVWGVGYFGLNTPTCALRMPTVCLNAL